MSMKSKLESAYAKALTGTFKAISPIKRTIKKNKRRTSEDTTHPLSSCNKSKNKRYNYTSHERL